MTTEDKCYRILNKYSRRILREAERKYTQRDPKFSNSSAVRAADLMSVLECIDIDRRMLRYAIG